MEFKVGDVVTVKHAVEAYYSGYAGNPVCFLELGEEGVISAVKVPKAYGSPRGHYFCCIDFTKGGREWRTSANYGDIRRKRHAMPR